MKRNRSLLTSLILVFLSATLAIKGAEAPHYNLLFIAVAYKSVKESFRKSIPHQIPEFMPKEASPN